MADNGASAAAKSAATDSNTATNGSAVADSSAAATQPLAVAQPAAAAARKEIFVQVEAFGSGVVLHVALNVDLGGTVGVLRNHVRSSVKLPADTRTVRLFLGHGGAELTNDAALVSDTPLFDELVGAENPLVVFPFVWRDATLLLKTGWCEDEYDADECADPDGRVRLLDADRFMTDPKGPIPTEIGFLDELTAISMFDGALTGRIPTEVGRLQRLTRMVLGSNRLNGPIPTEIGQLTHLTELALFDNHFTGRIPTEIFKLKWLTELKLEANMLTGPIPTEIGRLFRLLEFDASSNQLTGPIPSELGSLNCLGQIELVENLLTGRIPRELADAKQLWLLDLDDNQLNGTAEFVEFMSAALPGCEVNV